MLLAAGGIDPLLYGEFRPPLTAAFGGVWVWPLAPDL